MRGAAMKVGMCMFLWATKVDSSYEAVLRDIYDTGFDGVEIPVFEGCEGDYCELARLLDEIGLERTAVTAIGDPAMNLISPVGATRQAGVDYMKWVLDCTAALGATQVSGPLHSTLGHFSGKGPTQGEFARSVASQRLIGDHAASVGVTVGLEALNRFECYFSNTMDALCTHLDDIAHPNITAMYDTFHANIEEADPIGALMRNARHVSHIHISENDRGVPGRGNIPWADTYAAIREMGYDGWLTIESFGRGLPDLAAATKVWRDFAETREEVYRDGYAHIRKSMNDAGLT